ncbi:MULTISPECIES: MerR family transcriptional regulator [Planococcus]|uniref:MerR family transcriptional regulator n=1 Tax=Planococcus rifietoensis TaxID=200991 RepID=A0A0U2Z3K2_9BACL|nr:MULTISPECIES: MerR family transcriptional regulator [Planococcus]ALS73796.1 MerR family transcriptional regulator [Planococcus rifietoensis]AUD14058.1 MerR family transcriptional regulator [Planococcus sp. MB-3u-03]PKG48065.1 MerR family transcriptional regulator [Planococcus sp. Urea-trap-24]PKG91913.1 MerR family transcriptional regulator [Planococcus sp. Urea-3u-39]PKH43183.1 MerR family transcriptional regulator [Planococcus sp. MB-3u-09]
MTNRVRRTMPILPISIVMQLTDLTARQIRYYEEQKLISPARTEGNKRMFSLNDVDALLEIKDYLEQGLNVAGIRKLYETKEMPLNDQAEPKTLSDAELRSLLREEMKHQARPFSQASQRHGDLSRFFK